MGKVDDIINERIAADNRKPTIYDTTGISQASPKKSKKDVVLENNLKIVTELVREHGITRVGQMGAKGKATKKQERFLNILDMLYSKAIDVKDVKAGIEYLNRTAGSVSQTLDLNENKKKLIVLGTGKVEPKEEPVMVIPKIINTSKENGN